MCAVGVLAAGAAWVVWRWALHAATGHVRGTAGQCWAAWLGQVAQSGQNRPARLVHSTPACQACHTPWNMPRLPAGRKPPPNTQPPQPRLPLPTSTSSQLLVVNDDWMGHTHIVEVHEAPPTTAAAFAAAAPAAVEAPPSVEAAPALNGVAAAAASLAADAPALELDVMAAAEASVASFAAAAPAVEEEAPAAEPAAAGALLQGGHAVGEAAAALPAVWRCSCKSAAGQTCCRKGLIRLRACVCLLEHTVIISC